ncbi:GGDEF domain-containing protein [Sphingobium jiangsuense]|uniref:diguanylate cyclase n=1 Tax=Sphingobium jiangsuense TaxID=870476 RepID=A0A7W6BV85_9SPHN|nr:GGDEF domain-containing protein [Sphingobium jiangsuense]MBB3928494.1 diguanylate cyclase [Sphingobium jiangsuense]GLT01064.1 GGDEF domain-containing protein [Sphingobium jiangsuense]
MNAQIGFTRRIANWAKGLSADEMQSLSVEASSREGSRNGSSREIERRRQLYEDVGSFLFAHDLDITPVNFGLALDYLTGNDHEIEKAVCAILKERGQITNVLAEKIITERHSKELTVDGLSRMLTSVEENLDRFHLLATESRTSASSYGEALQAQVSEIESDHSPEQLVSALVDLTRSMVDKTRQIEAEMRENQKKTNALQQSLESARKAAEQDHLTGLPNRRAFEVFLKEEVKAASAKGEALSVAFCDIDHFKHINDTHGHDTGDRVLRFVGSLFARISSEKCHVARHGGEEFVLLFRGKSVSEACEIVDQTRADLAARNLVDRNSGERMAQVSFSGGVADVFNYPTPRDALKAADRALYLAKEHGRNRVYMAAAITED